MVSVKCVEDGADGGSTGGVGGPRAKRRSRRAPRTAAELDTEGTAVNVPRARPVPEDPLPRLATLAYLASQAPVATSLGAHRLGTCSLGTGPLGRHRASTYSLTALDRK